MESFEEMEGPEHPNTLYSINTFGNLMRKMGKFTEAEKFLMRAWEGAQKEMGPEDQDTEAFEQDYHNLMRHCSRRLLRASQGC